LWERAQLDDLLDGETRTGFMLRYTLSHPHASTVIVATLNPDHLRENLAAAARGPLSDYMLREVKRRLSVARSESGAH
jgi:aryl-alcohol dehydrogenase-like predicted oxidoreductase